MSRRVEGNRMQSAQLQDTTEARIELVKGHIIRVLSTSSEPMPRYELINRLPCGYGYAEAIRALAELGDRITITPDESGRADFALVQLKTSPKGKVFNFLAVLAA